MEVDIVHFMNVNENFGRALKNDDVSCRMEDDTAGEITFLHFCLLSRMEAFYFNNNLMIFLLLKLV